MTIPDSVMQSRGGDYASQEFDRAIYQKNLFHRYDRVKFPNGLSVPTDRCSVDIIIPFRGKFELVRKVLLSVVQKTRSNPYWVTLVDDHSDNKEFNDNIRQAPKTDVISLDEESGFGAAVDAAIAATSQSYICVLQSDCEIKHSNWLESLGESLIRMKDKGVAMVGARTNNSLSDVEGIDGKSPSDKVTDFVLDKGALPLHCVLFHRDLVKKIKGGFKHYPYAMYEDEEMHWRMKKYGLLQGVSGNSWVYHKGQATIEEVCRDHPNIVHEIRKNRDRCMTDIRNDV